MLIYYSMAIKKNTEKELFDLLLESTTNKYKLGKGANGIVFKFADREFKDFVFKIVPYYGDLINNETAINVINSKKDSPFFFIDYGLNKNYGQAVAINNNSLLYLEEAEILILRKFPKGFKTLEELSKTKHYDRIISEIPQESLNNYVAELVNITKSGYQPDSKMLGNIIINKNHELLPIDVVNGVFHYDGRILGSTVIDFIKSVTEPMKSNDLKKDFAEKAIIAFRENKVALELRDPSKIEKQLKFCLMSFFDKENAKNLVEKISVIKNEDLLPFHFNVSENIPGKIVEVSGVTKVPLTIKAKDFLKMINQHSTNLGI
jgi:hypothetical protein